MVYDLPPAIHQKAPIIVASSMMSPISPMNPASPVYILRGAVSHNDSSSDKGEDKTDVEEKNKDEQKRDYIIDTCSPFGIILTTLAAIGTLLMIFGFLDMINRRWD